MSILSSTKLGKAFLKITRDKLHEQGWFLLDKISLGNMDYLGIRLDIVDSSLDATTLETSYTVVPYYITKVKRPRISQESMGGLYWDPVVDENNKPKFITNMVDLNNILEKYKTIPL